MTGHVVQDGSFLLTKIAVSEHGNDREGVFWSALAEGLFWDGGGLGTQGLTQGLYKLKCQLLQIPGRGPE